MKHRARVVARVIDPRDFESDQGDPYSGSSLVPMLVIGLVLTLAGMITAVALS